MRTWLTLYYAITDPRPPRLQQWSPSSPQPAAAGAFVASVGTLAAVQLSKFHIIVKVPQYTYPELPHLNISTINIGHRPASFVGLPTLCFSNATRTGRGSCSCAQPHALTVDSAIQTTWPRKHLLYTRRSFFVSLQHRCAHAMMG